MTTSNTDQGERYGRAMLACVRAHAQRCRVSGDKVQFEGWWRGGDKVNCALWPDKGTWADAKTGAGGGAKAFAREVMGVSLRQFMREWENDDKEVETSATATAPVTSLPATDEAPAVWGAGELHQWWHEHEGAGRAMAEEGYLCMRRGFPASSWELIESGYLGLDEETVALWPEVDRERMRRLLARRGPAFVAPLRSAATNMVEDLYLRFVGGGEPKGVSLPSISHTDADGAPRGYGWAGSSLRSEVLVLCEGMADTLLAEAMLRDHDPRFCAVGAIDSNAMGKVWGWWLEQRKGGRVVVVYHLDQEKSSGALAVETAGPAAALRLVRHLEKHGVRAELFDWIRFEKALGEVGRCVGVSAYDLADVMKAVGLNGFGAVQAAFLGAIERLERCRT